MCKITKHQPQWDNYQNIPRRKIQAIDATSAVRKQTIERILWGGRGVTGRKRDKRMGKKSLQTGKEEHKQNETI